MQTCEWTNKIVCIISCEQANERTIFKKKLRTSEQNLRTFMFVGALFSGSHIVNIICSVLQNLTKTLYIKYEKCYQITDTLAVCSTDLSTKLFICGKGLRFYLSTCHNLVLHYMPPAYSTVMYFWNLKYTQIHTHISKYTSRKWYRVHVKIQT